MRARARENEKTKDKKKMRREDSGLGPVIGGDAILNSYCTHPRSKVPFSLGNGSHPFAYLHQKGMKLILLSCGAQRPDRRAIANCLTEISPSLDASLANELTEILLEGDAVDIEIDDRTTSSAFRALRKLDIEYEIVE